MDVKTFRKAISEAPTRATSNGKDMYQLTGRETLDEVLKIVDRYITDLERTEYQVKKAKNEIKKAIEEQHPGTDFGTGISVGLKKALDIVNNNLP